MNYWQEMSYNRFNYTNKNRLIEEEYNKELDIAIEKEYGIDMNIDWEE